MSIQSSSVQLTPYLRVQRNFPQEPQPLAVELNRAYPDIANAVNNRTIGIYPINDPVVNGETWFINGQSGRQQALRQVYLFTSIGSIAHGLNFASVAFVSPKTYGSFTDGTNWYGVIFGSSVAIAGQVSFYVTSTDIVVLAGAGAPSITQGYIVLEFVAIV